MKIGRNIGTQIAAHAALPTVHQDGPALVAAEATARDLAIAAKEELKASHMVRAYSNANQSINTGTATKATLDLEDYDVGGEFASNKFTVTKAGYYLIRGSVQFSTIGDAKNCMVMLYKDGASIGFTTLSTGLASSPCINLAIIKALTVGEYIELWVEHNHGAARDVLANINRTFLEVMLLAV